MKQELPTTQRQLALYEELSNIHSKRFLTRVLALCYIAVMTALIYMGIIGSPWQNTAILGAVQGTLTLAVPTMIRHYFPSRGQIEKK